MLYRRRLKYFLLKFLRLHGTPHKVALGFAFGSSINYIPTFGFAIPIAAFIAGIIRLNIVAAIIGDILFKPLFPVMFYLDVRVGHFLLGKTVRHIRIEMKQILMHLKLGALSKLSSAFLVGMVFNVIVTTIVVYAVCFFILKYYRLPMLRFVKNLKLLD